MLAVIFDCDGVLVDSEKLSCSAWLPVLARRGLQAELAEIEQFVGKSDRAVLDHFRKRAPSALPDEIVAEREEEYFRLAQGRLRSFVGLREALEELSRRRIPCGVASSGRPQKIHFNLREVDLQSFFRVVCSVTEVEHGKPAPDLFLHCAAQLATPPAECVVVEDSVFGIQAAASAGMVALGFTSSHDAVTLRQAGAKHTLETYEELLPLLLPLDRSAA